MMKVMNPLSRGSSHDSDPQPPDLVLCKPSKISRISSDDEGFDEGFDEPRPSSSRA